MTGLTGHKTIILFGFCLTVSAIFGLLETKYLLSLAGSPSPENIADYQLRKLSLEDYKGTIRKAIENGDFMLARHQIELALSNSIDVPQELIHAANPSNIEATTRLLKDGLSGALFGTSDNVAELSGTLIADLSGAGDIRDIVIHGKSVISQEPYDPVILSLASVGLVLTGSAIISGGMTAPSDVGISIVKAAYKSDKISKPLAKQLIRVSSDIVDLKTFKRAVDESSALNRSKVISTLKKSINWHAAKPLINIGAEVYKISEVSDIQTAMLVMKHADSVEDISKFGRISQKFGKQSGAVISLLGKSAITFAGLTITITFWVLGLIIWIVVALWTFLAIMKIMSRLVNYTAR